MDNLGSVVSKLSGSLELRRRSGHGDLPAVEFDGVTLPASVDKEADVEIPRRVWSAWIPSLGARALRRKLTETERNVLAMRQADLSPALAPYRPHETDIVAEALAQMFCAFPSLRATGPDAVAKVDSAMRAVCKFPAWAITRACETIGTEGYFVDADGERKRERHWPPSDPDIVAQVKREMRLRQDAYDQTIALLTATVEEP